MDIIDGLIKQFKKLKNIASNLKRLIVKAVVGLLFPISKMLKRADDNLSKSITNIKRKLKNEKSLGLSVLCGIKWAVHGLRKVAEKNTIVLKEMILDVDESDGYIYSSTNNPTDTKIQYNVDWKDVSYQDSNESISVGKCAYTIKGNGKDDEYILDMYFDSKNEPSTTNDNKENIRKKGKYLFCKEAISDIYNIINGRYINIVNEISENKDIEELGCELFKVKFSYGKPGDVIAVLYENKNNKWVYICSYKINTAHNILAMYTIDILHKNNNYFNIISEEETNLILDKHRLYRIENSKLSVSDIIKDICSDVVSLITVIGAIYLLFTQIKIPNNKLLIG